MPKNVPKFNHQCNSIKIAAANNQILHLLILTFRNQPIFSKLFRDLFWRWWLSSTNSQVSEPRNLSQSFFPQLGPVFSLRGSGYHLKSFPSFSYLVKREYRLMYKFKIDEFNYFILPAKAFLIWVLFYATCSMHNAAKVFLSLSFEMPLGLCCL